MQQDMMETFKEIIQNTLTLTLKNIGFKKQNYHYVRWTDNFAQTCNVQRSHYEHQGSVRFTINFGFHIPIVYSILKNSEKLPSFPKTDHCYIDGRIGHLIYNTDYWYEINSETSNEKLTKQLQHDIENHLLPMFQRLQTIKSLFNIVRKKYRDRAYLMLARMDAVAIMEFEMGSFELGRDIIVSLYKKALIPKLVEGKTVYPDGREVINSSRKCINEYEIKHYEQIANRYKITLIDV